MPASPLCQHGPWEWRTAPDRLILPASHAGEEVVRVHYREIGTRNFRSFLLMGFNGESPDSDCVLRAIAEHSTR